MAKENTRERKLEIVFASDKKLDKLYVTSDDKIFTVEGSAKSYAFKLKDDKVDTYRRGEAFKQDVSAVDSDSIDTIENKVKSTAPNQLDLELETLRARHLELFDQKAAHNAGVKNLKAKIEAEEARLAEVAAKDAEALAAGAGSDGGAEGGSAEGDSGADGGAGE